MQAAMEDEDLTEAMDGDLKEEEGVSVEIDTEVAAEVGVEPLIGMSASSAHPAADTDKQHLAEAAAEPASLAFAIGVVEGDRRRGANKARQQSGSHREQATT